MPIQGLETIIPEKEQDGILALAALLKMDKGKNREITKKGHIGRLDVTFYYRSSKCWMGRFGGGWQWALGVDVGSTSVHVKLLICSVMFHLNKKEVAK